MWRAAASSRIHRPKVVIADTIKGRGVSFMEHPRALADGGGYYRWHAGAPRTTPFTAAHAELAAGVNAMLGDVGLEPLRSRPCAGIRPASWSSRATRSASR